jgi:hypothetical protein
LSSTPRIATLALVLIVLVTTAAGAQVTFVFRQATAGRVDRIEISQQVQPDRELIELSATSGETYRIESDSRGDVTVCRFEFPPDRTAWIARREGRSLRMDGIVKGRAVARTFAIDGNPWYECVERSLQPFAVSGSPEPERFWMIEPYGGGAYLMAGRIERRERVEVNGTFVDAVRVIVRPAGFLSFIWSSTYWYSPVDGTFLKSESVRSILPLIPPTVVELTEDRRARR